MAMMVLTAKALRRAVIAVEITWHPLSTVNLTKNNVSYQEAQKLAPLPYTFLQTLLANVVKRAATSVETQTALFWPIEHDKPTST